MSLIKLLVATDYSFGGGDGAEAAKSRAGYEEESSPAMHVIKQRLQEALLADGSDTSMAREAVHDCLKHLMEATKRDGAGQQRRVVDSLHPHFRHSEYCGSVQVDGAKVLQVLRIRCPPFV